MVTRSAGSAGILAQMIAYQKSQLSQAKSLGIDITRLREMGVSQSTIAQMQAAGPGGIAEIHALAGGSVADVKQFNALTRQTNAANANTGAMATSGVSMSSLQTDQKNEQVIVRALRKGLQHGIKVTVVNGHLRTV
jgi:hypothetical protein